MLDIDVSICFILIFCGLISLILIFRDEILIFTTSRALRQLDHQESEELSRYLQTTSLPVSSHAQASGPRDAVARGSC